MSHTVRLDLDDNHRQRLISLIGTGLEGLRGDLDEAPERLRDPEKSRRDAATYERLLAGLKQGEITVPDEEARRLTEEVGEAIDEENHFAEVVAEHEAFAALLAVLGGAGPREDV